LKIIEKSRVQANELNDLNIKTRSGYEHEAEPQGFADSARRNVPKREYKKRSLTDIFFSREIVRGMEKFL